MAHNPLNGEIAERKNGAAHLMTAAEARGVIREMEEQVKSDKRRRQMCAFFAKNAAGKLSAEAVEVYTAYATR